MSDGRFYVHENIDGSFVIRRETGTLRAADWFWDRAEAERWCNSYNACVKIGEANLAAENEALRSTLAELVEAHEGCEQNSADISDGIRLMDAIAAAKSLLDSKGESE